MGNQEMKARISKMLMNAEKYFGEESNERSVVGNMRKLFDNKIIRRMNSPYGEHLAERFARIFVTDDFEMNKFMAECLKKALDGFFKPEIENEAIGQLMNALYSAYGECSEIQAIINNMAPFGWTAKQKEGGRVKDHS
ncbi:MAG: hypothetical protein R3B65_00250 [Candidatus Paceibacterota bacterium]